ncbi:o-succinylbenzoate--CoA ligase [Antrihabitans stalactiti]|uniref:O-succinylbenzoate--CoA ligase n=1 Tax=Antrihabitans stalactiti TaxID=2584121 RepID=A0A848KGM6_9NOCA|nr:o-succinylbenzoate--CoA ligase [Antrihabitans stalactiti]
MSNTLETLPIPASVDVGRLLPVLGEILAGRGPARLPVPSFDEREATRLTSTLGVGEPIDDDVALIVATSGTTGIPKGAMLSASALNTSATATHARLGGTGSWLLTLPPHHIAGLQVLLRSVAAGTDPIVIDVTNGFDPVALIPAIEAMSGPRRYTSLVPTQLLKVLNHPDATTALATLDAVLVGGAATPAALRERAQSAGITLVRTYGMSETCGGCVYDGVPLDEAKVRLDDGRVLLGGPMLASGYRGMPDHPAFAEAGWFRTDDAGSVRDGVLTVLGRLDEAISSGGLTIVPQVVETVLLTHPGVGECAVLGVPDERLGERVVAVVVAVDAAPTLEQLREHVAQQLDSTAAPRELRVVDALPLRGPGKVDRQALRALF